ncbi:MAG TPA: HPr family phosphocarrier protein [bacterium]|nr:HPr family phosphocarrier protein [bacterium]
MTGKFLIENKSGLHLRAVAQLVRVANTYDCSILVKNKGRVASAKSLLNLLAMAVPQGGELEIEAEGKDAVQAIEAIQGLARSRFGEGF